MGFAIAEVAANMGAEVILVSGPVNLSVQHPNITRIDVESTQDMFLACQKYHKKTDIIVMSAAVADYTPEKKSNEKIKKQGDLSIPLKKTTDILEYLGKHKVKKQFICGFALETNRELEYAQDKLNRKNLDMIVLNSLNHKGAGFKHDTNQITILDKKHKKGLSFPLKSKSAVALDILNHILNAL